MAGRKPIKSARIVKARVQIQVRATEMDVAGNTERNRLVSMIEGMASAGALNEFLLDALKAKLRVDEGRQTAIYGGVSEQIYSHPQSLPVHRSQVQQPAQPAISPAPPAYQPEQQVIDSATQEEKGGGGAQSSSVELFRATETDALSISHEKEPDRSPTEEFQAPPRKRRMGGQALRAMGE